MDINYSIARFMSRFSKNRREAMSNYFRKKGVAVGKRCNILSNVATSEAYLVSIGDDTTISSEVLILTHDASVGKIFGKEVASDVAGRVSIGSNCFIGARSTLLYGVSIANNVIVAAGSVVTKSITQERVIVGGNPAKVISTWDKLESKSVDKGLRLHGKKGKAARLIIEANQERLVVR